VRSILDLILMEGTSRGDSFHWIVALSFLGLGLLVGWVHGYYTARYELSKKVLPGDEDAG